MDTVTSRREETQALILRVADGDRRAFMALYDATSSKLLSVCLAVLRNRDEAEEVLQEVYERIWTHAWRYRAIGLSPMTWLITVARNAAIDRRRARVVSAEEGPPIDALADLGPNPEDAAIARSQAERIVSCLRELDESHADAVRGAYLEGMSYKDLAMRHEVPLNTMRTWLRRSLVKLRECLRR